MLDKLIFEKDTHEEFEEAIKEVLNLIGFIANRPEKETGIGPDDFCVISEKDYLVIECKNETVTEKICKHDCEQYEDQASGLKKGSLHIAQFQSLFIIDVWLIKTVFRMIT